MEILMEDKMVVCLYCGDLFECPTEEQIKIFGFPECCGSRMAVFDRGKMYSVIRALDIIKENIGNELLK